MSDLFSLDRFEKVFRSAVKHYDFSVADKISDDLYILSRDGIEIEADVSELRIRYGRSRLKSDADFFATELDSRFALEARLSSLTNAQAVLRLMVVPENRAEDNSISIPFAGSLMKTVYYTGDNNEAFILDSKYLKKWGVPKEVLFSVADRNMGQLLSRLDCNFTEIIKGVTAAEIRSGGNPFAVSTVLCSDFRELISSKFGESFLVALPSADNLLAVHEIPRDIFESLSEAVLKDYRWADRPLTSEIFRFSPDGIYVVNKLQ